MYGIIAAQLVLTTLVAAVVVSNRGVQQFMLQSWGVQVGLLLASCLMLIPLYVWRHSHPSNLLLLGGCAARGVAGAGCRCVGALQGERCCRAVPALPLVRKPS